MKECSSGGSSVDRAVALRSYNSKEFNWNGRTSKYRYKWMTDRGKLHFRSFFFCCSLFCVILPQSIIKKASKSAAEKKKKKQKRFNKLLGTHAHLKHKVDPTQTQLDSVVQPKNKKQIKIHVKVYLRERENTRNVKLSSGSERE